MVITPRIFTFYSVQKNRYETCSFGMILQPILTITPALVFKPSMIQTHLKLNCAFLVQNLHLPLQFYLTPLFSTRVNYQETRQFSITLT